MDYKNLKHLRGTTRLLAMFDGKVQMKDIDKRFVLSFQDWLCHTYKMKDGGTLSGFSIYHYMKLLNVALGAAMRADIISENPFAKIERKERVQEPESKREFLEIDEVRRLIKADCKNENLKQAFLFSCFCGLRLSDVIGLKWENIHYSNGACNVDTKMQKTQEPIYLPLSDEAQKWLPERGGAADGDKVFKVPSATALKRHLTKWVEAAGITKKVTYHTSRHTFATLMLTLGADIYTTSKLLGHSDVSVTQVYAKIIDKKKNDAVKLMDGVF